MDDGFLDQICDALTGSGVDLSALGDSTALLDALASGHVRHAALDVFAVEPLPPNHPLTKLPNVTLSAHSAFRTPEASDNLIEAALAVATPDRLLVAAQALRDGLEEYDRGLKVYRGPLTRLDPAAVDLSDEAAWRGALRGAQVPRDIAGWYPAVVLEIGQTDARIGIERVAEDAEEAGEDGHRIVAEDVTWARKLMPGRERAPQAKKAGDLLAVGDVVLAHGVCATEAEAQGKSLSDHLTHLVVHGVLHLLGFDHAEPDEEREMFGLQRDILVGFAHSQRRR